MALRFHQNHPILAFLLALLFTQNILYTAFAVSGGSIGDGSFIYPDRPRPTTSGGYYYHGNTITIDGNLGFVLIGIIVVIFLLLVYLTRPRVLKIQVAISGMAHSIQKELSTLATTVDTSENESCNFFLSSMAYLFPRQLSTLTTAIDESKKKSLHFFLTESAVALLRHQKYWISGYSSVVRRWSLKAVEKEFRQLSTDERVKYDIESLVNVDNMKVQRTIIPRDNEVENNYIVVTILVAVNGALTLPEIKSTEDLRTALHYLNTISASNTLAVEVLWSPQAEHDTLSEDELLENYPLLRPI